ncbi:MAG: hypothetical protein Kow00121_27610 [Elainellaceae cyanobacterium]
MTIPRFQVRVGDKSIVVIADSANNAAVLARHLLNEWQGKAYAEFVRPGSKDMSGDDDDNDFDGGLNK